jgi:hypothetical protein
MISKRLLLVAQLIAILVIAPIDHYRAGDALRLLKGQEY